MVKETREDSPTPQIQTAPKATRMTIVMMRISIVNKHQNAFLREIAKKIEQLTTLGPDQRQVNHSIKA